MSSAVSLPFLPLSSAHIFTSIMILTPEANTCFTPKTKVELFLADSDRIFCLTLCSSQSHSPPEWVFGSISTDVKRVLSMFPWAFLFLAPPQSPSLLPATTNQASDTASAAPFWKRLHEIRLESIFPPRCVLSLPMTEEQADQVLQHFSFWGFIFFFISGSWHSFRGCFFQNYSGQLSALNQICQVKPLINSLYVCWIWFAWLTCTRLGLFLMQL